MENQPVSEQPKTRKVRSDKGVPRGPYGPRAKAEAIGPIEQPPTSETPAQEQPSE